MVSICRISTRVGIWGDCFYNQNRFSVSRPVSYKTGGVPISKLRSLPQQLIMNKATQQVLMMSLSVEDLKKACKNTKAPLISEIRSIHRGLEKPPDDVTVTLASLKRRSVPELAELLVDFRKRQMRQLNEGHEEMAPQLTGRTCC